LLIVPISAAVLAASCELASEGHITMLASLDTRTLRIFLAVAERHSMTEAGRYLGITQSAVSQSMQQLEQYLGVAVFDRDHRPLQLTAAGSILAHRAAGLISEIEQIASSIRQAGTVPEIRLGMIDSFAGTVGPYILPDLMEKVGNVTVRDGVTDDMLRGLSDRELDLIVCMDDTAHEDSLEVELLLTEPFVVAVPRVHLDKTGSVCLAQLSAQVPLIRYSQRSSIGSQIERQLRRVGAPPRKRLELDGSDTVFAMIANNVGWSITTPLCILHGRPDPARVALLPFPGPVFERRLILGHRKGEYTDVARRFARASRQVLQQHCALAVRTWIDFPTTTMTIPEEPVNAGQLTLV
jgi:DNA-binding transcriptional LysR family regulator